MAVLEEYEALLMVNNIGVLFDCKDSICGDCNTLVQYVAVCYSVLLNLKRKTSCVPLCRPHILLILQQRKSHSSTLLLIGRENTICRETQTVVLSADSRFEIILLRITSYYSTLLYSTLHHRSECFQGPNLVLAVFQ